ncbi:MAG TPA: NifB/NifX family molybdenum-iron cluster-binding protein [Bacillota bacterium]|nr:NifB/NifX family molybdenum-iron cluster-binding protein [Bacillota bacterium]
MKIAMPYLEGEVNAHFGSSREFVIFETENGQITGKKIITNEMAHNHGGLIQMLRDEGTDVVITGGIGMPMANALQRTGIKIVTGASGDVERVAGNYLNGRLVSRSVRCSCSGRYGYGRER